MAQLVGKYVIKERKTGKERARYFVKENALDVLSNLNKEGDKYYLHDENLKGKYVIKDKKNRQIVWFDDMEDITKQQEARYLLKKDALEVLNNLNKDGERYYLWEEN